MQYLPGKRVLALVIGLAAAGVGSAYAQDTTETGAAAIDTTADTTAPTGAIDTSGVDTSATRDTTDTSGVENPPGYRGMERDTTVFPDTGSSSTDTSGVENPPGYRGMERDTTVFPDTGSSSSDTGAETGVYHATPSHDTAAAGTSTDTTADTTADTTSVGDTEPIEPDAASPRLDPSGDTASQSADSTP